MTDLPGGLDGGLDEPEELQPAEGSLRLVGDGDTYDAAAWEAATAAVLRKARRLGDDAPDSDVWAALSRTTLDGIDVAPIGQPSDLDGLTTSGRPSRTGAWDVRTQVEVVDAKAANEAALQDLENGATSLALHLSEATEHDWATLLDGVLLDLAPVVLDRPSTEQVEAFADFLEGVGGRAAPRHEPLLRPPDDRDAALPGARGRRHGSRPVRAGRPSRLPARRPRPGGRRHGAARRGSQRRAGAGLGHRDRRRLPPPPRRRRLLRRARRATGRVPPRGHRRAVPDHRQAPGGPPAVGPRARGVRGQPARWRCTRSRAGR